MLLKREINAWTKNELVDCISAKRCLAIPVSLVSTFRLEVHRYFPPFRVSSTVRKISKNFALAVLVTRAYLEI